MKALVYCGPRDIRYETVPEPVLPDDRGAIVRVRAAGICGSDLHIYHGHGFAEGTGYSVGHEAVGVVETVGSAVSRFQVGDQVFVPGSAGCGRCGPCDRGLVVRCEHPGEAGAYGIGMALGGCQAERVAVPAADMNLSPLPAGMSDETALVLTDSGPTGWYAAHLGRVGVGDTVAVVGAGPVGLMAASAAHVMGAARVLVIDLVAERRARAASMGFLPVEGDPIDTVRAMTGGHGADVVIEAVGSDETIQLAIRLVATMGRVAVVGVTQNRSFALDLKRAQAKCLEFAIGYCSVQHELPALIPIANSNRMNPSAIVSHHLPLEAGAEAYRMFADRTGHVSKVALQVG